MKTHEEKHKYCIDMMNTLTSCLTATVSYVGKANYKEAEKYIRDFRTWTNASGNYILIEIAAVNGKFSLDFIQPFRSPLYVNAFLKELEENGTTYDLQDVVKLDLPDIRLPWRVF